jgi:hypothetical protein
MKGIVACAQLSNALVNWCFEMSTALIIFRFAGFGGSAEESFGKLVDLRCCIAER